MPGDFVLSRYFALTVFICINEVQVYITYLSSGEREEKKQRIETD